MAIIEQTPLTLPEVISLAGSGDKQGEIKSFIRQFTKEKVETAKNLKEELTKLDLLKLKEEHIVKIADFVPKDAEDIMKVLQGVSLNQDEVNKILEVVKKY